MTAYTVDQLLHWPDLEPDAEELADIQNHLFTVYAVVNYRSLTVTYRLEDMVHATEGFDIEFSREITTLLNSQIRYEEMLDKLDMAIHLSGERSREFYEAAREDDSDAPESGEES